MQAGNKKRKLKIYALYKGDKFITEGTKKEISKETGISIKTLDFLHTPANQKRCIGNNHKVLINIEEEEECTIVDI